MYCKNTKEGVQTQREHDDLFFIYSFIVVSIDSFTTTTSDVRQPWWPSCVQHAVFGPDAEPPRGRPSQSGRRPCPCRQGLASLSDTDSLKGARLHRGAPKGTAVGTLLVSSKPFLQISVHQATNPQRNTQMCDRARSHRAVKGGGGGEKKTS